MPEIKFSCPACKVSLKVSDTIAGKKIKCPKCAAVVAVPSASASPAAPAAAPAALKPALPAAKPAVPPPVAQKPSAPVKPPVPLAPAPLDISDMGESNFENDEKEQPAPTKYKKAPKKSGSFVSVLALLLALLYVAGIVVVYLGIVLPLPEALTK
jgi:hypothetical protein